ncbi:MAG: hypothetical protein J07HR59_00723 [Halorubrum sp. J07HR59]|nr:MAG: hypothetical protein J07HR59_00723 [Halorubrum sp. J07HR59]
MNNYTVGCPSLQVQSNQKLDASLARIEQRGRPQDNLLFSFVRNDCSGSQPAACALSAHMENSTKTTTISNSTTHGNTTRSRIILLGRSVIGGRTAPGNQPSQHTCSVSNSSMIFNTKYDLSYCCISVSVEVAG